MRRLLLSAIAVSSAACQSYPFSFQTNQRVDARSYQVQVTTEGKTDILFVIDNSGSMAAKQANLQANAAAFIRTLTDSVNEYQVGIISTDFTNVPVDGQTTCDPCCDLDTDDDGVPDFSNCDGGRLVAADGQTRFFERPTAEDPDELEQQIQDLVAGFNANIGALGVSGSPYEASFNAMRAAMSPDSPVGLRALNYRFLRPEADLAVIFVTDEDECSYADSFYQTSTDDGECYYQLASAIPVQEYIDFLASLKGGDVRKVRAAAIYGSVATNDTVNHRLKNKAAGCFTDGSLITPADPTATPPVAANDNDASDVCGCWQVRFLPDRTTSEPGDEYYCNLTANAPYGQLRTRTPSFGNDQGGCLALPGSRYEEFLNELDLERTELGAESGVLADSVCRSDYGKTLQDIISRVILSNCFDLVEPPAGTQDVDLRTLDLSKQVILSLNGVALPQVARDSGLPGWYFRVNENDNRNQLCLEGGVIKKVNDIFEFTVIANEKGFDDQTSP